jgi:small redox-active disulfide protein 2
MKEIKLYGTGCGKTVATAALVEEVAKELGVEVRLVKIENLERIFQAGVMANPGVVIAGQVMHQGSVPDRSQVVAWLAS